NNLLTGISLSGASNSILRSNRVYDTGGYPNNSNRWGISVYGGDAVEVTDNIVAGVFGTPGYYNEVIGIFRGNFVDGLDVTSSRITGNRISGLAPTGTDKIASGISSINYGNTSGMNLFANNDLFMTTPVVGSIGIKCRFGGVSARDNNVRGFPILIDPTCMDDGGNVTH
ncbi:MAG: hypothetical protein L0H23_05820, partial [Luteimonas sp.]|nr:hypothetical protein [Luteimonas sp.]